MTECCKNVAIRPGHLTVRKQRIERWAFTNRTKTIRSTSASFAQKRSESALFQEDRRLHLELYRLGEEREKLLERINFDQKLFANKQALKHKDNPEVLSTLNYVRKCCKYSNENASHGGSLDPKIFSEEKSIRRFRPPPPRQPPKIEICLVESEEQLDVSSFDDDEEQRHVQFKMHKNRGSQSAHLSGRKRPLTAAQRVKSARQTRSISSAPEISTIDPPKQSRKSSNKSKRPSSRIFATKSSLEEFRRYPERFLSQTNRYLPLLRRQATEIQVQERSLKQKKEKKRAHSISHLSDASDFITEEVKSFLSEEIDDGKSIIHSHLPSWDSQERRITDKVHVPNRINLMETNVDNNSEQTLLLSRLRDREYTNLQTLIRSNSIQHILEPLSVQKDEKTTDLDQLLQSIDSLCSTNKRKPKLSVIERNRSKFGILLS